MTLISLLSLPTSLAPTSPLVLTHPKATLLTGLTDYISRCQTFEGGISGRPDAEAHGAYAFCALAALSILGPPSVKIPKHLDVPRLVAWLSARQYAPEGGFAGRTGKVVDGCYSWWVGGCWDLVEAAIARPSAASSAEGKPSVGDGMAAATIYSKEGLIRYILCCCQDTSRRGGLRDKPSKISDAYHTCYVLAGLSAAQNEWAYDATMRAPASNVASKASGVNKLADEVDFDGPYRWRPVDDVLGVENRGEQIWDEVDRVRRLHPVFVVPEGAAEAARTWFLAHEECFV